MIVVAFLLPALIALLSAVAFALLHPRQAALILLLRLSRAVFVLGVLAGVGLAILTAVGAPLPTWTLAAAAAGALILAVLHFGVAQPALLRRLNGTR